MMNRDEREYLIDHRSSFLIVLPRGFVIEFALTVLIEQAIATGAATAYM
jgi:hypothetical protein